MKLKVRILAFLFIAGTVMTLAASTPQAANPGAPAHWVQGWGAIVNYYNTSKGKNSLDRRTKGMITLAATRDKRALTLLADRYASAESPEEYIRVLTLLSAMKYLSGEEFLDSLDVWSSRHTLARDNWLMYRVMANKFSYKGEWDEAVQMIKDPKSEIFRRAAAIEAAGVARDKGTEVLNLINWMLEEDNMPKLSKKLFPNAIHYVGVCSLLANSGVNRQDPLYTSTFEKIVVLFDEEKIDRRIKLMMGRRLQSIYGNDEIYVNSFGWRGVHYGEAEAVKSGNDNRPEGERTGARKQPAPTFAGISANGDRFAYVIDISDSMLQPVKKPAKVEDPPKKGPITGKSNKDKEKEKEKEKEKKKKNGDLPSEDDLDWDKVENRFDLAREYLRISLERTLALSKLKENKDRDMFFTIIFFNENADYFKSTKGLVKLTSGTVAAALKELDAVKPTKTSNPNRPNGTLSKAEQGYTNMHGGLRRAFGAKVGSFDLNDSPINPDLYEDGVDTIFLLSDGAPSYSDWPLIDPWEEDVRVGDPETGKEAPKQDTIVYHGPYHITEFIADDVRRQNLLRTAELHCIGIGEADTTLLALLARENWGKTKFLGN